MTTRDLSELKKFLDKLLMNVPFQDYCPNGLQVEGKKEIKAIATAVSAGLDTIQKAAELKVDALIVHHGMFWQGDSFVIEGSKKKKLEILFKSGISLFAYHLPLDAHPIVGNNWKAARDLGWTDIEPFGLYGGQLIGVKGKLDPLSHNSFRQNLENYYGSKAHVANGGKEMIHSAALISGGAYRDLKSAATIGVDAFVTGNFDEPAWQIAHEEGIHFYALGHTATEKIGPKALAEHLTEEFDVPCQFIDTDNPF